MDAFGNDLNFLAAAVLLALAAGFGIGGSLMSFRWFAARIVGAKIIGAVLYLGASAVAAGGAIWLGLRLIPAIYGFWTPWIAYAIGAAVIAFGIAVLVWLFLSVLSVRKSQAAAG
ncbi:MAG TPA: hypothetical protein VHQ03_04985 [Candidatus Dormibacteraeota bacterium]|nr:hypothetical protein [Candidatus Dormibacteraeota bacterium]